MFKPPGMSIIDRSKKSVITERSGEKALRNIQQLY